MTDQLVNPSDGWSNPSGDVSESGDTYVYDVTDSARVIVSLTFRSGSETRDFQIQASTVEEIETISRHDFVVDTYDDEATARDHLDSFMDHLAESLSTDHTADDRLFLTVQQSINEFTSDGCRWRSLFSGGGHD